MHMVQGIRSLKFMFTCFFFLLFNSIFFSRCRCNGSDTISTGQSLFPNQTIVSKQGKFEVGFFTPGNSTNYYVGLWYKNLPYRTFLWVANRDNPIPNSFYNNSRLEMLNGNLNLIVNSQRIWMLSRYSSFATEAAVLDTGNFVLRNASGIIWQSFDHPTGTWLPGGIIGFRRNIEAKLISWRNANDPGTANYSLAMERNGGGELSLKKNGSQVIWRSGVWQRGTFASLAYGSDLYNFSYVHRVDDLYLTYNVYNESMMVRIVMSADGRLYHFVWSEAKRDWIVLRVEPLDDAGFCKKDARCGPNAICDVNYLPACRCLTGFAPRVKQDWDSFNFSKGCERVRPLQCDKARTGYVKVNNTVLPANPVRRNGDCEFECSVDCSCNAYANVSDGGCLLFMEDLLGLESVANSSAGEDLYVRTESVEHSGKGKRNVLVVALVVVPITAAILIYCFWWFFYRRRTLKSKVSRGSYHNLLQLDLNTRGAKYNSVRDRHGEDKNNHYDQFPIFSFWSIAAATNNFSITNKLGQGGFGPVYKGELLNGQFVAVKRLSAGSRQGLEEFRNETELIAKLQHRNLVGILGCCIENDEKILVYEYMPNKSLDFSLFEPSRKEVLDWKKSVDVIEGIAQGLLYLHHYSPLRIVHRDLKASNILLDAEMKPKISDFGMARIFGENDWQANTERIVGTRGYIPPEYVREGRFSVKSDVFAFGVLMLEIISGRKNTGSYGSEDLNLLGYAWNKWKHDSVAELIDPVLEIPGSSSCNPLKYVQIGLLCVQENPADRPLMSDVVAMLNNDQAALASPKNPAFTVGRTLPKTNPTQPKVEICSANGLTISHVEGR